MKTLVTIISALIASALLSVAHAQSPNGTRLPPASSVTDCSGTVWTMPGGVVYMQPTGAAAATKAGVTGNGTILQISNCVISYQNGPNLTSPPWSAWSWVNGAWVQIAVPLPVITPPVVTPPVTCPPPTPITLPNWVCQLDMGANPPTLTCAIGTTA